jgi:hypothetical protein
MGDKRPAVEWAKYQNQMPEPGELYAWFSRPANLAVITGWQGLVVIDFDSLDAYFDWLQLTGGANTYQVVTRRGVHVYAFIDEPVRSGKFPGGDLQASGKYVLAPPSIHPEGTEYLVLNDAPIIRLGRLADLLPELADQQRPQPGPAAWTLPLPPEPPKNPWQTANQPPVNLVREIKSRLNILDFLPGAKHTREGFYMALCPLHDDHNPSLWVDSRRQICGCYAGCNGGKSMDVINLYARLNGLDNVRAIEQLREVFLV